MDGITPRGGWYRPNLNDIYALFTGPVVFSIYTGS